GPLHRLREAPPHAPQGGLRRLPRRALALPRHPQRLVHAPPLEREGPDPGPGRLGCPQRLHQDVSPVAVLRGRQEEAGGDPRTAGASRGLRRRLLREARPLVCRREPPGDGPPEVPGSGRRQVPFPAARPLLAPQGPVEGARRAPEDHHPSPGHACGREGAADARVVTADRRGARATGVLVGLCLVLGAVWALLPRMLGAAGGPEPELISAFRTAELARAPIPVPGAPPFEPRSLRFDRFSITVDGDHAFAVATLDASGACGGVEVSSLGRERVGFRRHGGRWEPDGPIAPALAQALSVLWQRARLLSGNAPGSLGELVLPADRERALGDARIDSVLRLPGHR